MTPSPLPMSAMPGEHSDDENETSPIMTWGELGGTPMVLDSDAAGGRSFQMHSEASREALARSLDRQVMAKKRRKTHFGRRSRETQAE